jgi:hypothetical protein
VNSVCAVPNRTSAVIASEAKQSISPHKEAMDCFVASLLAMTEGSHPLLPGGHLTAPALLLLLPLLLPLLLVGAVAADEASGGGAEHAVVPRVMTGDAADHGALQAALGVGRMSRERKHGRGEQCGNYFHDEHPQVAIRRDNRITAIRFPARRDLTRRVISGMVRKHQTSDAQLRIGESRDFPMCNCTS